MSYNDQNNIHFGNLDVGGLVFKPFTVHPENHQPEWVVFFVEISSTQWQSNTARGFLLYPCIHLVTSHHISVEIRCAMGHLYTWCGWKQFHLVQAVQGIQSPF